MTYYVRLMRQEDIAQVTQLDRESFPSIWPPINYRHELGNRLAHYIVAGEEGKMVEVTEAEAIPDKGLSGLALKIRRLFNRDRFFGNEALASGKEYIVGFAGFWIMVDEAHLISIAVREEYH